ncbi:uncharacterized protein N7529_003762 [Penicillium soppii]|uniref:uncharacterized protein n=1 Tax=Penicillium soppii TaxID=69789 RepID=UPI002549327F|nr:uncharacterized protein N7529_003762 [Penicillium soppii]KAJ5871409.1 hypothetical protein N7529_003762 [Penicillium soppii]
MDNSTTAHMSNPPVHRGSWGSTSSAFSNIEMSFSHDSCYGSDEVSVTSNGTAPGQSNGSTSTAKQSLRPFLKSILKNSSAMIESDEESDSESGYSSDGIDSEYDALSDEEEEDDYMSDFSVWEETSRDAPETHEDHTESFDDVFISFEENSVRFALEVQYIDTPELSDDEEPATQMTCHEMMMLARNSSGTQTLLDQLDKMDIGDENEVVRKSTNQPEEFSRDAVDLDRSLFVAYMNGIHGVTNKTFEEQYETYLRTQVDHIRLGKDIECMSPDDAPSLYLDLISSHVIGTFFNLLAEDELNELITLRAEEQIGEQEDSISSTLNLDHHQVLLNKIEKFLMERLADGLVDVAPDELTLFAGGIVHDLDAKTLPAKV